MMRKIVEIDEKLCNGCGECVPNCVEGALRIIDGKARIVSDLFCDGLGACIGGCPVGAIAVVEREAEPYDEWRVMERIARGGPNVIKAHLEHMISHGEREYLKTARDYLVLYGIPDPTGGKTVPETRTLAPAPAAGAAAKGFAGCPGSAAVRIARKEGAASREEDFTELTAWPVQLHLINPNAPAYKGAHILLASDCSAFAAGNFHSRYLKGRALAIACPKLDTGRERYVEKLAAMMRSAASVTVLMMEVPCCGGLLGMAVEARAKAGTGIPVTAVVLNIRGEKISEREVS